MYSEILIMNKVLTCIHFLSLDVYYWYFMPESPLLPCLPLGSIKSSLLKDQVRPDWQSLGGLSPLILLT